MRDASKTNWIEKLTTPQRLNAYEPLAIRFLLSIRLIAVHRKAKRDPVPELTAKLGNVPVAIAALEVVETLTQVWPEPIQVSRMCCQCLTHDETTLANMLKAASLRDSAQFKRQLTDLMSNSKIDLLWEQAVSLVATEYAAG